MPSSPPILTRLRAGARARVMGLYKNHLLDTFLRERVTPLEAHAVVPSVDAGPRQFWRDLPVFLDPSTFHRAGDSGFYREQPFPHTEDRAAFERRKQDAPFWATRSQGPEARLHVVAPPFYRP
jgi:hypothetical protein